MVIMGMYGCWAGCFGDGFNLYSVNQKQFLFSLVYISKRMKTTHKIKFIKNMAVCTEKLICILRNIQSVSGYCHQQQSPLLHQCLVFPTK